MAHKVSTSQASKARSHPRAIVIFLLLPTCTYAACQQDPIFLPVGNCTINLPGLPTIHSWGAPIAVSASSSSSTLQYLCGVPSTVTNTTFYTTSLLCSDANIRAQNLTYAQCLSRRGGGLLVSASGEPLGPDALTTTSTADLNESDPGWATIMKPDPPFPAAVSATLHLHGRDSITMTAGLIESGTNHTTTHLSLGDKSVLLSSLVAAKRIAARAFGFDAGSQSHALPRAGGLVLGGWDDGARAGAEVRFPMADYREAHQLNGRRTCPLQVTIASMVLRPAPGGGGGGGGDDYPLGIEPAHPQQACLEMYDNLPRLPSGVIAKIRDGFQAFTGSAAQPIRYAASDPTAPPARDGLLAQLDDIYIPEPGLIYPTTNLTAAFNGSLVIMLAESNFTVEIPLEELVNPVRGVARDGTRVVNANFTELAVYQDPAPEDAAVLGKVFLSRAYLYVDYDRGEFTLAQAAAGTASGRTILVAAGNEGGGACGGSEWTRVTVALVAVVTVLGVALLGLIAYWLWRRRGRGSGTGGSRRTLVWPWGRRRRTKEQPLMVENGGARGDDPEVYRGPAPTMTQVPTPVMDQEPPVDTTPVPTERTVPPPTAVEQRLPSHDNGNAGFRSRLDSVEVPGTSPLDPAYSPDGQHPELDGRERTLVSDSPRTHEMVEMTPVRSSFGAQRHHPIERLRKGSGSTSADSDPLHVTRTNRSMSGQSWV